ncbi:MAG: cytochrome c family protein [Planctomycetes bacterium]|nr:cytochrome c family protein [Planctomycetota bacterium]
MRGLLLTLSLACLGCCCVIWAGSVQKRRQGDASITLFLSGQEQGQLKPCGCSGGQLGGLERRGAVFNQVPPSRRLVINTGSIVEAETEQNLIKFSVFVQAFSLLGYDVLHLTARDLQIEQLTGALAGLDPSVSVITAEPVGESQASSLARSFSLGGREVAIRVIAVNARTPLSSVREASQVRVFILDSADEDLVRSVLEIATAEDCVLLPSELDDPKVFDFPATEAQVLSVGRRGRHVGRLDIRPRVGGDGLELRFQEIEVSQELINDPRLVDLYKSYQGIVRDSHLMDRVVRVPLPEGGRFTGSSRCQDCHEEVYAIWQDRGHAHAYGTLVKVGSDMDPECVVCHVVGMEFEEGFVSLEKTPQFPNVGCEVCHGPGADHVVSGGSIDLGQPRRSCLHCHTPEHSGEFAEHREEYREKIKHW